MPKRFRVTVTKRLWASVPNKSKVKVGRQDFWIDWEKQDALAVRVVDNPKKKLKRVM